jgi:hypothetical protein
MIKLWRRHPGPWFWAFLLIGCYAIFLISPPT